MGLGRGARKGEAEGKGVRGREGGMEKKEGEEEGTFNDDAS